MRVPITIAAVLAVVGVAGCAAGNARQPDAAIDASAEPDTTPEAGPDEPPDLPGPDLVDLPVEPPPDPCTRVEGMHTCASSVKVPPNGGEFCGDTSESVNFYGAIVDRVGERCNQLTFEPDLVFEIKSASEFDLSVVVNAAWQPALYLRTSCSSDRSQIACEEEDDPGVAVGLEQLNLAAGTYYLILDGQASSASSAGANRGEFRLRIDIRPVGGTGGGGG